MGYAHASEHAVTGAKSDIQIIGCWLLELPGARALCTQLTTASEPGSQETNTLWACSS